MWAAVLWLDQSANSLPSLWTKTVSRKVDVMGYQLKRVDMTSDEMHAALKRVEEKAPDDWFMAKTVKETRTVLDTLAGAGLLESSCVTRSAPYYHLKNVATCQVCKCVLTIRGGYCDTGMCGVCCTGESALLKERGETW